jgi:acetyltransferase-like isoleucine patch superfamily enzyme
MIQPLAYIHPQAKIADNVVIEPFVTIHKDVEDWRRYLDRLQLRNYGWRPHR